MKYNYYEYDGSDTIAINGSIRDNNIHAKPNKQMDNIDLLKGVRLKECILGK